MFPPSTTGSLTSIPSCTRSSQPRPTKNSCNPEPVPGCYAAPQALARTLLYHPSNGLIYPSVRRPGHTCVVCFRPALVYSPRFAISACSFLSLPRATATVMKRSPSRTVFLSSTERHGFADRPWASMWSHNHVTHEFEIGTVPVGSGSLFLIAGPCVIESEAHARKMADAIQRITSDLKVPYIFKASYDKANRTSVKSFRGPGLKDGSTILRRIAESTGLPVLTDVHEPSHCEIAAEGVGCSPDPRIPLPPDRPARRRRQNRPRHQCEEGPVRRSRRHAACRREGRLHRDNTRISPYRARRQLRLSQPRRGHALATPSCAI